MNVNFLQKFRKIETILLGILLYGIILVYTYQYFQIANKYEPWTTDEIFYYLEAKAIAAHNIYQTPASLDGNTSYIGDFGFHGISYAIKDGWLSKLFFQTEDPPLVFINFLTCLATLTLILLFKPFTLNTRIKIALVVATHYVLFSFTLSYMQETIQYFFAVLALRSLYHLYQSPVQASSIFDRGNLKVGVWIFEKVRSFFSGRSPLAYFLIIIVLATAFRYSWLMWGLGLLPLANNLKSFAKWGLVVIALVALGLFFSRYIMAPYPYGELLTNQLIKTEQFSLMDQLRTIYGRFSSNLQLFLTPAERLTTTYMRYTTLTLLIISTWYAIVKRNKFSIACTLIGWAYFIACMIFSFMFWAYDERALAVLNPLLGFSLLAKNNSFIFYPVITIQLLLFSGVVEATRTRNIEAIAVNVPSLDRTSREASFSKIKEMISDDHGIVVAIDVVFIRHGTANYFVDFPLVNSKGYPIHYRIHLEGIDLRGTHPAQYILSTQNNDQLANRLIYCDKWIYLYKIFE
ncbi:MAG: hypothetical protein V4549_00955 [Bacteroidota bacterium]